MYLGSAVNCRKFSTWKWPYLSPTVSQPSEGRAGWDALAPATTGPALIESLTEHRHRPHHQQTHLTNAGAPIGLSRTRGDYYSFPEVLYVFKHLASFNLYSMHIPVLWYFEISTIYTFKDPVESNWLRYPPFFVYHQYLWHIAIKLEVRSYNIWANKHRSGCSLLGGNHCETELLVHHYTICATC